MTKRKRDNLVYGGLAAGSVVFLLWVIPTYTPPYPGYGVPASLVPNVAVGVILGLSVLALLRDLAAFLAERSKGPKPPEKIAPGDKVHLGHFLLFMVPCALLMSGMQWIGFIPAGIAFMLLIQYLCGQRKPITALIVTVVTVGGLYGAMRYGLSVPMP